jgi:hypothetical protein
VTPVSWYAKEPAHWHFKSMFKPLLATCQPLIKQLCLLHASHPAEILLGICGPNTCDKPNAIKNSCVDAGLGRFTCSCLGGFVWDAGFAACRGEQRGG